MGKDIVIVAPFADLPEETGNCRYFYLADMIAKQGKAEVELVISAFSHLKKQQRDVTMDLQKPYPVTFIEEPGYAKNVSIRRFASHHTMGNALSAYLEKRKKPDVILCAIPSLDAGAVVATYCKQHQIPFVIDVQDLWPEAFQMVLHIPLISSMLFYPLKRRADMIYRQADEIIAVSDTYAQRAKRVNHKVQDIHSVYLGTNLNDFDAIVRQRSVQKPSDKFLIAYVGTLGHSYDIKGVIQAVAELNKEHRDIWFVVMGNGPLLEEFQEFAKKTASQTHFLGRLPYPKMVEILSICDVCVNPIAHHAAQSIINKVGDYAAAGLPVVSTQECLEYRELVSERQIGFNCENSDVKDLATKLLKLYENTSLRDTMGRNNRLLAQERFDRATSYQTIVDILYK